MGKSWRGAKFEFFGLLRSANVMDDIPRWAASVGTISTGG
jgi:hypothetical protein